MSIQTAEQRLSLCGSHERAGVLVAELQRTPSKPTARRLLRDWFNLCDAMAPWRDELLEQFRRVGFVTDTEDELQYPVTIYRAAWADEDPRRGLSWTLDRSEAEAFARRMTSARWRIVFGIERDDVDPVVWQAECFHALGYITGRNESEVIPDPDALVGVEVISVLVSVDPVRGV